MQVIRIVIYICLAIFTIGCRNKELVYPIYFDDKSYSNIKLIIPNQVIIDSLKLMIDKFDRYSFCYRVYTNNDSLNIFWYNFGYGHGFRNIRSSLENVGHIKWMTYYFMENNLNIRAQTLSIEKEIKSTDVSTSIVRINNSDTLFLYYNIVKINNEIKMYLVSNKYNINELIELTSQIKCEEIYNYEYYLIKNNIGITFNLDSLNLKMGSRFE